MENNSIRVDPSDLKILEKVIRSHCKGSILYRIGVFVSRADPNARGGDMDLFIEIDKAVESSGKLASRIGYRYDSWRP